MSSIRSPCPPLQLALVGSKRPSGETVSDVGGVAGGASEAVVEVGVVDGARVVLASSGVEGASVAASTAKVALGLGEKLLETVTVDSTSGTITDHLEDHLVAATACRRARAGAVAVVGLHESGVADTVVGGRSANTANALLHHYGKNEAVVDARLGGDRLDGAADGGDLLLGVVDAPAVPDAGVLHGVVVCVPELIEAAPGSVSRPALLDGAVAVVHVVHVGDLTPVQGGSEGGSRQSGRGESKLGKHRDGVVVEVLQ